MAIFIAAFAITAMIFVFLYVQLLQRNATLIEQRNRMADGLIEEHRMRHNCVGPLYVAWDVGEIVHTRQNEVFNGSS